MFHAGLSNRFLRQESQALLTRLDRVQPFSLTMPTVAAAALPSKAWFAIEHHLIGERRRLQQRVRAHQQWLQSAEGRRASPAEQQQRFTLVRLLFNAALDEVDIFADVLNQRSEHETGTWLSGLDVVASDALRLSGRFFDPPALITYLDRGHGAAIRRARTRLPGGSLNPVAVIRVPRERMVGSGIGSSLVHEVGHQGAALLKLVESLRTSLVQRIRRAAADRPAWVLWERWISEIVADFWSLAKLGIAATLGLIGVVSLPRAFVFRIALDDPHPVPWIRAVLSCAMGCVLYPDRQWRQLETVWRQMYPLGDLPGAQQRLLGLLQATMPEFVRLLIGHRPQALWGKSLAEVMPLAERRPAALRAMLNSWRADPRRLCSAAPTLVLAVLGQARWDGAVSPEVESNTVARLLTQWAIRRAIPPFGLPIECSHAMTAAGAA